MSEERKKHLACLAIRRSGAAFDDNKHTFVSCKEFMQKLDENGVAKTLPEALANRILKCVKGWKAIHLGSASSANMDVPR